MKKGWKIFWIVCGITAAVGLICCVAAFAMGVTAEALEAKFPYGIGWVSHQDEDTEDDLVDNDYVQTATTASYSGIREIEGELFAGNVEFIQTEDEEILVETEGLSKRLGFRSYADGDTLYLTTNKNLTHMNQLSVGRIRIYLPQNIRFEEVSVELGAGVLNMDYISADCFSVDAGAGEVNVNSFDVSEAEFQCGAGSVTASGNVKNALEIECGVGEIHMTVDGCKEDYNYDISCGIGEVVCGDSRYSGIGHDEYIDNHAAREMNLDCGIGQIIVQFKQTKEHQE